MASRCRKRKCFPREESSSSESSTTLNTRSNSSIETIVENNVDTSEETECLGIILKRLKEKIIASCIKNSYKTALATLLYQTTFALD